MNCFILTGGNSAGRRRTGTRPDGTHRLSPAFGLTAQMPKEYLVPKSICDYSLQEVYYLDEEAAAKERANGSEVLYYMGEEIPMFRFSGVTVTVEWMRGMIGAAILTGAVGALLGTGIAEILEKGRKKSGQYE